MRDHIRLLGILNIAMGCLVALIGIVILIVMGGAAGFISAQISNDADAQTSAPIVAFIGLCIAIFFLVLALPSIIAGWGLLNLRPWARILGIIVSIFHLLSFPFGTALGVYGLWVLFSEEARRIFEGPARAYGPPAAYAPQANPPGPASYPPQPPPGV